MTLNEAKEYLNENNYELIDEGFTPPKVWVITFGSEEEAAEEEYLFSKEGGWDSVFDVTLNGKCIYIPDSEKASKIVPEWFGDKAELLAGAELSDTEYGFTNVDESTLNEEINNPDEPATKKQLWALFCITRQDYRNKGLTKGEASELLQKLSNNKDRKPMKTVKKKEEPKIEGIDVGDIFAYHFGYSMSLNNYVKVKSIKGKKATVVELGKDVVSGSMMQGRVRPNPDKESKETQIALIKPDDYRGGVCLRVPFYGGKYVTFRKWDGTPDYEDHMD